MKLKEYLQRIWDSITNAWGQGKIQRNSRITYDVMWNIILFFIIGGTVLAVFAFGAGAGYFASLVKDEPVRDYESMRNDIYNYEETSKLYFADNNYIGDIRTDLYREEIALNDVSDLIIEAVIATEDQLFYEHSGVVPKAIVRAMYQEVSNADTQTGGSTLSQQLIKNQLLTNEVSFERKAKEILLAMRLENFFEKDEILEAYLNVIPYGRDASGRNIAGIETAAKGIFGVEAKDLSLSQAAYLAGIPQNPYAYTPFTNNGEQKDSLEQGKRRMKVVLKRMYKEKFITEEQYNEAIDYKIEKDFVEKASSPTDKYPAVVKELEKRAKKIILKQLVEDDGLTMDDVHNDKDVQEHYQELADRALRKNGYHIHSTINKDMYETMQKVGEKYKSYGPNNKDDEPIEAGAVLMENNTGKVLSFYPGRNYDIGEHEFNYATQAHRQPGSTFKPLSTYAPAMDLGKVQPGSVIADVPTPSGRPKNYGGGYYGLVSAREALTHSYNVTADHIYKSIMSHDPRKNYLEKMGLHFEKEDVGAAIALGGLRNGVTVEENTSAFTTLSNNGEYAESYMVEKITDSEGKTIYEHEAEPTKVFSPQASYLTIDMMRDVMKQGTAASLPSRLQHGGVDWAGKTGTSDDYRDAWFVGTNPNITLGTWIGYDTPSSIYCPTCSLSYSQRNQALWADFVNALTDIDAETMAPESGFKQPKGIVSRNYCATSGMAPSDICSQAGLVRSDIYQSKYVPNKTDDSLIGGNKPLVNVDGEQVIASSKTPSEFTTSTGGGFTFNPDWIKRKGYNRLSDLSQLIPRKHSEAWKKVSATTGSSSESSSKIGTDNGENPPAPASVSNQSGTLSWNGATDHLVVGYRIYHAGGEDGEKALVGHTTSTAYKISDQSGVYYVKAVNYFGRESSLSDAVTLKPAANDENENEDQDEDQSKDQDKDKKDNKNQDKDKDKNKNKEDKKKEEDKKEEDKTNHQNNSNNKDEDKSDTNNDGNNNDKTDKNSKPDEETNNNGNNSNDD